MSKLSPIYLALFSLLGGMYGCFSDKVAGGGTETNTEVAISGVVVDEKGPISGAVVTLIPVNYNPLQSDSSALVTVTTKTNGSFESSVLKGKNYNLLVRYKPQDLSNLTLSIAQGESQQGEIKVPTVQLKKNSTVSLHISELKLKSHSYVYVPGTTLLKKVSLADSINGILQLTEVPASTYDSLIYTERLGALRQNLFASKLVVPPNSLVQQGPYSSWRNSWNIEVNTSLTGQSITENLFKFALLLRLDSTFLFSTSDGRDLRATKSDGITPLPLYIEKWDQRTKTGVVWVLLDTLYANQPKQSFKIYLGKDSVASVSKPSDIFGVSNHVRAAWNFNDRSKLNSVEEVIGRYTGKFLNDKTEDHSRPGNIANSLFFNNSNRIEFPEDLDIINGQSQVTISLWFQPRFSKFGTLLDFSPPENFNNTHSLFRLEIDKDYFPQVSAISGESDTPQLLRSPKAAGVNQWNHLVASIDYSTGLMKIFLNGEEVIRQSGRFQYKKLPEESSKHYTIGVNYSKVGNNFDGYIDDLKIMTSPISNSWVKATYDSQKDKSTFVNSERLFK